MDAILSRLSEIEEAANRIVSRTEEQKAQYAEEMKAKTTEFDRALQESTQEKIAQIKESLRRQRETALHELRSNTQTQIEALEAAYEKNHSELAEEIKRRILEA